MDFLCARSGPSCQTIVPPFFFHFPNGLTVLFGGSSQLARSKKCVSSPSGLKRTVLLSALFGRSGCFSRSKPTPIRGDDGAVGGFFSAERRKVKEELDDDGVEHDGDESSEGVGERVADGVSRPCVEDMAECG